MANDTRDPDHTPVSWLRTTVGQLWRDALSVYYANTPVWRWLKSGALVFFGFFLWSAASLVLSVRPDWGVLTYVAAYGIVLVLWGPLTHMAIVPLVIRLRRTAQHPITKTIARQGSKLNLSVFFAIVIVLGTFPAGPTVLDFGGGIGIGGDGDGGVSASIDCDADEETVTCLVTADGEQVDHVVVLTGGEQIAQDSDRPFEVAVAIDDLAEVVGQKEFEIEVRNAEGETLARFVRTVPEVRS